MDEPDLRSAYERLLPAFERAARNVRQAIDVLVTAANIPTLAITSRVKQFDSLRDKVERKKYNHPFDQATDCVGIRVIAYLPNDVHSIKILLTREFDVVESTDKSELLRANEFGYRSHHLLVRIPMSWASTPNYRGLENITIEVQIRTILMHAWAEIEHKLQYKSTIQVPHDQRRRLFMLSAKVEEADAQFQSLVADVAAYRGRIAEELAKTGQFDTSLEFNLDTLKELLRFFYPSSEEHNAMTQQLFDHAIGHGLALTDIVQYAKAFQPLEEELDSLVSPLTAAAKLDYALEVLAPDYLAPSCCSDSRLDIIQQLKSRSRSEA